MKKYFWTMAVIAVFAIGFAASDDESSSSSSTDSEKKEKVEEKPSFLGTYEVKDKAGILYHFIIKENEKVEIIVNPDIVNGSHTTFTGKWYDERSVGGEVQICYDDIERMPGITYPNGIDTDLGANCPQICKGYLYSSWMNLDKKKSGWRLEAKKIK